MNKVNRKKQKNEKGFTMIELIIVVAIMGIIGAVLVPTFSNMTTKARLTSDITSVKTLQRQLEVYKAEVGTYPDDFEETADEGIDATVIEKLVSEKYIDGKDVTSSNELKLQTDGELWVHGGRCYLRFESDSDYATYVDKLKATDPNKGWAAVEEAPEEP